MNRRDRHKIESLEYQIRKKERGLRVLFRQGEPPKRILEYGEKIEKLQDELEILTGRREPKSPRWPL